MTNGVACGFGLPTVAVLPSGDVIATSATTTAATSRSGHRELTAAERADQALTCALVRELGTGDLRDGWFGHRVRSRC